MDRKQQNLSVYSNKADAFAKKFNSLGAHIEEIKKVFSLVGKNNPAVFEIGCGNGRDAKEILKYTNNYLGIDLTPEMIEIAKKDNPTGNFRVGDLEYMDYPVNLDVVFAFASLLHSPKEMRPHIFKKVWEALNPKGIFCFNAKVLPEAEFLQTDEFGPRIFYSYDETNIKELAQNFFNIIKIETNEIRRTNWVAAILQKQ